MKSQREVHFHLVSDSTGETVRNVSQASIVQFENVSPIEHSWPFIRSLAQVDRALQGISQNPGIVLFTIVEDSLRQALERGCRDLSVPCISVIDPVIELLDRYLGTRRLNRPGGQHAMDEGYFGRIEAMTFVIAHDDGQHAESLNEADVILVGVSRTSKTPTCMYLANRGIKAANIPFVPGVDLPDELARVTKPLVVGLTTSPERLSQMRENRLLHLKDTPTGSYADLDHVREEVVAARRIFSQRGWPVIDTTRRSIEETAAAILQLYAQR